MHLTTTKSRTSKILFKSQIWSSHNFLSSKCVNTLQECEHALPPAFRVSERELQRDSSRKSYCSGDDGWWMSQLFELSCCWLECHLRLKWAMAMTEVLHKNGASFWFRRLSLFSCSGIEDKHAFAIWQSSCQNSFHVSKQSNWLQQLRRRHV